jgi:hypothetical protein
VQEISKSPSREEGENEEYENYDNLVSNIVCEEVATDPPPLLCILTVIAAFFPPPLLISKNRQTN